MFENYKDCLFNEKTIFKKQQRFKNYYHDVYTEKINKVALSSNDNKGIQTFERATTFPQETPAVKVCENETLGVCKAKETFKMLGKECENDLYVTCNIFLNYMKTKSAREMKNYVKFGTKKMLSHLPRHK